MRYDPRIYSSEKRKWRLLKKYKGCTVEEVIKGQSIDTTLGNAYRIINNTQISLQLPHESQTREAVLEDLRLIRGIGKKTAEKLRADGLCDLNGLCEAGYTDARPLVRAIESSDFRSLLCRVERQHSNNHPLCYSLLGFLKPEDILFFDIETMGLKYKPVFLIGVGRYENGYFNITQYLARNLSEERGILKAFIDELERCRCLVSFNGRSFDSRFIRDRLSVLGMEGDLNLPHLDLLHMSRRVWKGCLPNHRLGTVEKHILGIQRENDLASAMVPNYYELYLKKGNPGPLIPIIEHNHQDILSMASLLDLICKEISHR